MTTGTMKAAAVHADGTSLYRVGGLAAIVFGIAYVVIFPRYVLRGGSAGWWRGVAQLCRWQDRRVVGHPRSLRP